MLCRAKINEGCVVNQTITKHAVSGSFNFPTLERSGDSIYLGSGPINFIEAFKPL